MKIINLIDEDIVNYKKCSMFIIFPTCSFKCDKECGQQVCQNSSLAQSPIIEISTDEICKRYLNNPITEAFVFGGLEPFDSNFELIELIDCIRYKYKCADDIVIYTGYKEEELNEDTKLKVLYQNVCKYSNITIKFGRFIPDQEPHIDKILGVKLASNNQYGKRVS